MPFEFDVTRKFRPGANEVVVRVLNPPIGRELEGFRAGYRKHRPEDE
jgi:hypothetical protein